jgi:nucleoside-diphosphate-sugar epimerase
MITAFVAGATGYTGAEVVRQLATSDTRVVAHVRPDSAALPAWRARFTAIGAAVDVTPWERDALVASLRSLQPDVVFALLGTTRVRARAAERAGAAAAGYEEVDYGLTHMLLEAASLAAPAACFVYLSAMGVRDGTRNAYLRARVRIEQELRGSRVRAVIARPGLITGPDRMEHRVVETVAGSLLDGAAAVLSRLGGSRVADRIRPITAQRLARALIAGADRCAPDAAAVEDADADAARVAPLILNAAALHRLGRSA